MDNDQFRTLLRENQSIKKLVLKQNTGKRNPSFDPDTVRKNYKKREDN